MIPTIKDSENSHTYELETFPNHFEAPQQHNSLESSRQLSLVHEAEFEDSKYESKVNTEENKSALKSTTKIFMPNDEKHSKSIDGSEAYVDYNFENKSEEKPEEEIPKENNSHFSPLEMKPNEQKSEELSIDLEEENHGLKLRQEPSLKKYKSLIFPDDNFKQNWEIVLAIMILYSCLWVPYDMAFIDGEPVSTLILDGLSDFVFFIDILVNFNSAFYDSQDVLIFKRSKIATTYIKFWFWLDLVSALPFSFIFENQNYGNGLKFQKLIKLTRFLRIFKMIKERNRILKYLNNLLKITSGGAENILGPVIVMTCFCHVSACFYYMLCDAENLPDTWISLYIDKGDNDKYLTSFYWVTQTVVTTGYGDVPCITSFERMFSICLMFIGVMVYSFCVGSLSNFLIYLEEQNEAFNEKLVTLYSMKHRYNLDFFLVKRIERFLRYGKKTQIREEQKDFVLELPKNLKIELSAIIYKNLIDGVEFFTNKPKRFMAFVCPYLKSIKFKAGDIVVDEGDRANEIYFLKTGGVAIVLKQYENFKFMKVSEGYYFGEVDLLFSKVRTYSFMAETDCELLCMNKLDFMKVFFKEFKEIGAELYRTAVKKRAQLKEMSEKAKKYCQKKRKSTLLIRKTLLITDSPSERKFYRKSSNITKISGAENEEEKLEHSNSSNSPTDHEGSPNEKKDNLIKLQKVEMDSNSQTSEKNALDYEKKLEVMDAIVKIDDKIDNVEKIIHNFFMIYDEELQLSQNLKKEIGEGMKSSEKMESLANGLETMSDGGIKDNFERDGPNGKYKNVAKVSRFFKNKEN